MFVVRCQCFQLELMWDRERCKFNDELSFITNLKVFSIKPHYYSKDLIIGLSTENS